MTKFLSNKVLGHAYTLYGRNTDSSVAEVIRVADRDQLMLYVLCKMADTAEKSLAETRKLRKDIARLPSAMRTAMAKVPVELRRPRIARTQVTNHLAGMLLSKVSRADRSTLSCRARKALNRIETKEPHITLAELPPCRISKERNCGEATTEEILLWIGSLQPAEAPQGPKEADNGEGQ